ncbi:MAG: ribosome recycling factor [Candidatus Omnitrophica bacterium]|nr:ribosome recycling factor [Candidatus Omnitrophota bacterium]
MTQLETILHDAEDKMKKAAGNVSRAFNELRGGRASTSLVESVKVDYYGTPTPIKQLATLSTPEPRLLVIQPWDANLVSAVVQAIQKSDLGVTPQADGKLVRVPVPALTKERRDELDHLARKMAEDGRIAIRTVRRDANEAVKKLEKDKLASRDEAFKAQERVQKLTDQHIHSIDEHLQAKEQELLAV